MLVDHLWQKVIYHTGQVELGFPCMQDETKPVLIFFCSYDVSSLY